MRESPREPAVRLHSRVVSYLLPYPVEAASANQHRIDSPLLAAVAARASLWWSHGGRTSLNSFGGKTSRGPCNGVAGSAARSPPQSTPRSPGPSGAFIRKVVGARSSSNSVSRPWRSMAPTTSRQRRSSVAPVGMTDLAGVTAGYRASLEAELSPTSPTVSRRAAER